MNCNQVFDILTRGPFPTGQPSSDDAVERHLVACHDCRQLADALRPAVELLHESIESEESGNLPGYRGVLHRTSTGSLLAAVMTAIETDAKRNATVNLCRSTSWPMHMGKMRFASAAMLGAALCVVLWAVGLSRNSSKFSRAAQDVVLSEAIYQPDASGRQALAALNLPEDCIHPKRQDPAHAQMSAFKTTRTSGDERFVCCTQCHSTANPHRPPVNAIAMLARSCGACHIP